MQIVLYSVVEMCLRVFKTSAVNFCKNVAKKSLTVFVAYAIM